MAIPYAEYPRLDLLIIIIVQIIFMIIVGVLIFSLLQRYLKKKVREVRTLMNFFILLEISCILAWIPKIMNYLGNDADYIYGLPLGRGYYLWWTNFSYIFNTGSTILLISFTQQLFKVEKPKIVHFYALLVLGFNIWSVYHGIFVYVPGGSSLTMGLSVYMIILNLYSTSYLYRHAKRDISRLPRSIYRFGYKLIYISSGLFIFAYLYWALSIVLTLPKWASAISWALNTIILFLLGLGLLLPNWFRKYMKKHYNLGEIDE